MSADRNKSAQTAIGVIPIDSIYTPVYKVNYTVENTRVGNMTDFDKRSVEASEHFAEYYAHVAEQFGCDFLNAADFAEAGDIDYLHMTPESHENLGHAVAAKLQEMLGE